MRCQRHKCNHCERIVKVEIIVVIANEYSQVPNKQVYSFIPNERVGLLFWTNYLGLNKQVGWKIC